MSLNANVAFTPLQGINKADVSHKVNISQFGKTNSGLLSVQGPSCPSRCCGLWTCMAGCTAFPQLASGGSAQTTCCWSWSVCLRGRAAVGALAVTTTFTSTWCPVRPPSATVRRPMKTRSAHAACVLHSQRGCCTSSVLKCCCTVCVCFLFFRGGTQWIASQTHCCPPTAGRGATSPGWILSRSTALSCPPAAGSGRGTGMWIRAVEENPATLG